MALLGASPKIYTSNCLRLEGAAGGPPNRLQPDAATGVATGDAIDFAAVDLHLNVNLDINLDSDIGGERHHCVAGAAL